MKRNRKKLRRDRVRLRIRIKKRGLRGVQRVGVGDGMTRTGRFCCRAPGKKKKRPVVGQGRPPIERAATRSFAFSFRPAHATEAANSCAARGRYAQRPRRRTHVACAAHTTPSGGRVPLSVNAKAAPAELLQWPSKAARDYTGHAST